MREVVCADVEDVAGRRFRENQRMAWRARHDVEERERFVVFIDLVAGQLATQNFGEDIVWVVIRHRLPQIISAAHNAGQKPVSGFRDCAYSCSTKSLRNGAAAASSSAVACT